MDFTDQIEIFHLFIPLINANLDFIIAVIAYFRIPCRTCNPVRSLRRSLNRFWKSVLVLPARVLLAFVLLARVLPAFALPAPALLVLAQLKQAVPHPAASVFRMQCRSGFREGS